MRVSERMYQANGVTLLVKTWASDMTAQVRSHTSIEPESNEEPVFRREWLVNSPDRRVVLPWQQKYPTILNCRSPSHADLFED